jgi:glycine dehydrogenase subunit 1
MTARALDLPLPLSEPELLSFLDSLSRKNVSGEDLLGAGCDGHFVPSALKQLLSRSEFYTAYTPYQAEASQGTLQAIYEYQSLICALTGMDVANASMYDGATAMAEAAFLACRVTGRKKIAVSSAVHPEYRRVLRTYATCADLELSEVPYDRKTGLSGKLPADLSPFSCFILSQPNFFGCIEEVSSLSAKIHGSGGLFIVDADPISLGLLKPPAEYGADIVVGEGRSLGTPRNFGGPGLGIFAAKEQYVRQVPGRLVGKTVDLEGKTGYTLTLQAREQHIRRERAASNICSNEALCALAATVYLTLLGKNGLRTVAELCLERSEKLKKKLGSPFAAPTFSEFVTTAKAGLSLKEFYPELKDCSLVCSSETARI